MAIQFLPCGGDSDVTFRVTLEGDEYYFRFRYIQRLTNQSSGKNIKADEWYLYLSSANGTQIFQTPLRTNREILRPYYYRDGCPQGSLIIRDMAADLALSQGKSYSPERISFDNFGIDKRFRLVYVTSDSFER